MIILKKILPLLALLTFAFFSFSPSAAAITKSAEKCSDKFFGIPVWYQYLEMNEDCTLKKDANENVPAKVILGIIDIALFLAGLLAVIMIIWGGFQFIFANGEPGSIANARKTILNAVIGLIIAILASQIVRFVAYLLSK